MTKHALARLIAKRMGEKGWRRADLAARLGYRNIAKGMRRLSQLCESFDFLANQHGEARLIARLPDALELPASTVQSALISTLDEYEMWLESERIELRRRFKPYLFVETDDAHTKNLPLFIRAVTEHFRVITLPDDFKSLTPYAQIECVREEIERTLDARTELPVWGRITGFTLWLTIDEGLYFDIEGQPDYEHSCRWPPSACELSVRSKSIPPGIINKWLNDG